MVKIELTASRNPSQSKIIVDGVDITNGTMAVAVDVTADKEPRVILTLCPERLDMNVDTVVDMISHVRLKKPTAPGPIMVDM